MSDDRPYDYEAEETRTERDRDKDLYTPEQRKYGLDAPTRAEAERDL